MTEIKKTDLLFLQNELLKDISALDKKLSDKITQLSKEILSQKLLTDQKFELNEEKYNSLLEKIESNEEIKKIKENFTEFTININQKQYLNNTKISVLEKDLKSACFKFDNLFNNNISTPALIGNGAKYKDIKVFREFVDKQLGELIIYKEKNIIDIKKYKEKTDNAIGTLKIKVEANENKYFDFCYEKITEAKKEMLEKFNLLEESLNNLKIENGKYSFDLIKKSEELENQINILNNIKKEVSNKLNEQFEKYENYNNNLVKLFESQKDEFILIKSRFTELSEFIKDVRFMRNLGNYNINGNQNNDFNSTLFLKGSRMLSKKINFDKPQKISKNDEIKYGIKIELEDNKENNNITDTIHNNYIINNELKQINDNKEKEKEKESEKIKYNIKANINIPKNLYSPKENNNKLSEKVSIINSAVKTNSDNISLSLFKGRNKKNQLIDESVHNKTSIGKMKDNNNDEFLIKNKSVIYINKQGKTEDNNKNKNIQFKKIHKDFIKDNSYFDTNTKNDNDFKFNIIESDYNNEINEKITQTTDNIYRFIDEQILDINKKIKDVHNINKYNIDKMNKKLDFYINLNNVLLLKFKNPKNLTNKQLNILTNYEFKIPLINKSPEKNKLKFDKIKLNIKENTPILTTKNNRDFSILRDNKDIKDSKEIKEIKGKENNKEIKDDGHKSLTSSKIIKIIEPYLIKKFKNDIDLTYKK